MYTSSEIFLTPHACASDKIISCIVVIVVIVIVSTKITIFRDVGCMVKIIEMFQILNARDIYYPDPLTGLKSEALWNQIII